MELLLLFVDIGKGEKKMLSIVVPVYMAEKYLPKCLDSILNQTYTDVEIVLINDGSSDRSPQICDEYARKDRRVRVIHKQNAGVAVARNTGIEAANGEYVTFVDSDDWIEPTMYAQMMAIAKQYDCDLVMCDCVKEHHDRSEIYTHEIRSGFYDKTALMTEYYPHLLMMENVEYPATISNWLCLFKKEKSPRYIEGIRYSEDLLFGAQLAYNADSFFYMKGKALYHYCMHDESVSHSFDLNKWSNYKALYNKTQEWVSSIPEYDFSHQLDLMLLFFFYNTTNELRYTNEVDQKKKKELYRQIIDDEVIKELFQKITISRLQIPTKQKILTVLHKYKVFPM